MPARLHAIRYTLYAKRAFTLIELMVTVAIFTVVIGASYAILNAAGTNWRSGDTSIELQEDVRQLLDSVAFELFETAPLLPSAIGPGNSSITFQIPVDEHGNGTWENLGGAGTFYLEDTLNASGAIVWGAYLRWEDRTVDSSTLGFGDRQGREISFLLVGDEFRRRILAADGTILEDFTLSDDIASVNFSMDANNVVRVTINAQKLSISGHQISYSVTTETIPRNS